MLDHVLAAARELSPAELIVVVGHARRQVTAHLATHAPDARVVVQDRQCGTGHAVRMVTEAVALGQGTVVVTYADTPLLRGSTLAGLVGEHAAERAAATALTTRMADPTGYGRIVRDAQGAFAAIVEEADATPEQRAITEINSGVYAFDSRLLTDSVKRLPTDNAKGEEYLTDVVAILRAEGHRVATVTVPDADEVRGVNDRVQLAHARRILNARMLEGWMRAGVTIVDPLTTLIDRDVVLGRDVEIGPGTQLTGSTVIEAGAHVGPGCLLRDTAVGEGAVLTHVVGVSASVGPGVTVDPFTYLPPGTELAAGKPARPPAGAARPARARAAGPAGAGTARPARAGTARPAEPGAAVPAEPGTAGPADAGAARPARKETEA
jgi:bifunctional UDP-N-acetylglucosamine pyrophosphorylase/glucosamine-1-phosphate N-acetyltransferase